MIVDNPSDETQCEESPPYPAEHYFKNKQSQNVSCQKEGPLFKGFSSSNVHNQRSKGTKHTSISNSDQKPGSLRTFITAIREEVILLCIVFAFFWYCIGTNLLICITYWTINVAVCLAALLYGPYTFLGILLVFLWLNFGFMVVYTILWYVMLLAIAIFCLVTCISTNSEQ